MAALTREPGALLSGVTDRLLGLALWVRTMPCCCRTAAASGSMLPSSENCPPAVCLL